MKLLAVCDAACDTGFGTVSRNVLSRLAKEYDYQISTCAINYHGDPHPDGSYMQLFPANLGGDLYGQGRLATLVEGLQPDVIWLFNDPQVIARYLQEPALLGRNIVAYFPIDSRDLSPMLVNPLKRDKLTAVTYTAFGRDEVHRTLPELNVEVIAHGIDTSLFKPSDKSKAELKAEMGMDADLVFLNANRNQERKNIPATLRAFGHIKDQFPKSKLHMHMVWDEMPPNGHGWNVYDLSRQYSLHGRLIQSNLADPAGNAIPWRNALAGVPIEVLVLLYQAADVFVTTTMGEGWGLTLAESLACGTPVVATDCSSIPELVRGRGLLAQVRAWMTMHFGTRFALVDEKDAARKMAKLAADKGLREAYGQSGVAWAQTMTWEPIVARWDQIFRAAARA